MLTPEERPEFLIEAYFRTDAALSCAAPDLASYHLTRCVRRAYLDFARTIHGMRDVADREAITSQARDYVYAQISQLRNGGAKVANQRAFDDWHRATCKGLLDIYDKGQPEFFVGQAQKWVNMTLKYVFVVGEEHLPGFEPVYRFCHMPLDWVVLRALAGHKLRAPWDAWSRIKRYDGCKDGYLEFQKRVREHFRSGPLLKVEHFLWLGQTVPMPAVCACSPSPEH